MDAVTDTLTFAGSLAPGSRLVFSYLRRAVLDDRRYAPFVWLFRWRTGLDPRTVPELLSGFGLELLDDLGQNEYERRYLRPLTRSMTVLDIERVAVTRVSPL
jgi:hypothetical protein